MAEITRSTSLQELAALISQALESAGILATLSGGSAVSLYTDNRYQSQDLDFVTSADPKRLEPVVAALGFVATGSKRLYEHPQTEWLVEFPAGPLGFGHRVIDARQLESLNTPWGPLRVITPTLCVMDRLAAFCHWQDRQCWDQALLVAQAHTVDWQQLHEWATQEGLDQEAWQRFRTEANGASSELQ